MKSDLPELPPQRRKMLWVTFWFVFLGTPAFLLFAVEVADRISGTLRGHLASVLPFAVLGGIVAAGFTLGFLFVRLTSRSHQGFIRDVITFGVIFTVLLVVILAVTIPFVAMRR